MFFQKGQVKKIQTDRYTLISDRNKSYIRSQRINHPQKNNFERMCALRNIFLSFSPMNERRLSEKASFDTFFVRMKKASLAVETAIVLPLFFFGMITLISFMNIYQLQTEHLSRLCQAAKQAGMYAYTPDGEGMKEITLPDIYSYKPIGGLIPLPTVWMYNTVKVHAWTGGKEHGEFQDGEPMEHMVYVTQSGGVYHKDLGCSYLNLSVNQVSGSSVSSRKNDYGEHYTACELCSRNQNPAGTVFITKTGNHYHNLENCSGLKRNVRMVKESEAPGAACSRCG